MLRVTVELLPAYGGPRKVLAVAEISNVGGTSEFGDYDARFYGGEPFVEYRRFTPAELLGTAKVKDHPRKHSNVWMLVAKALMRLRLSR